MSDQVSQTLTQRAANRFRSEDGNIASFSIILFTLMVMCGGLAVDLMRYEQVRTSLQQTLDRCTLAAAALAQGLDPEEVCRDYVDKAGLTQYLTDVQVTEGLNFRQVEAFAMAEKPTFFAGLVGIDEFEIPGASSAEQRITDIEIAMVLDVSGSMVQTPSRIVNLKSAASEFVETVLVSDVENRTSIALVPYNGQVNMGPVLAAKYNISPQHNIVTDVNCVDLPASVYSTNGLSRTLALPQTGYVDSFTGTSTSHAWLAANTTANPNGAMPILTNMWCPQRPQNIIRLPNNDVATLQSQINGLDAVGATSINAGMKWGMTMLDPSNRPMFAELVSAGAIPSYFDNRPFDYVEDGDRTATTLKVIVLMTDGSNFEEDRLKAAYRSGLSPIYLSGTGVYSIRHQTGRPTAAGTDQYFVPSICTTGGPTDGTRSPSGCDPWLAAAPNSGGVTQLTWPQVWANQRMSWVAWQMYARALGTSSGTRTTVYNNTILAMRERTPIATMNSQLQGVCDMARDQNVIVFGIAFEAPDLGKTQIRDCSSTPAQYYEASGVSISTAFRSIAAQISQLRLTQ
jgi:Putative Flp pilus-assembly TadE/G-like